MSTTNILSLAYVLVLVMGLVTIKLKNWHPARYSLKTSYFIWFLVSFYLYLTCLALDGGVGLFLLPPLVTGACFALQWHYEKRTNWTGFWCLSFVLSFFPVMLVNADNFLLITVFIILLVVAIIVIVLGFIALLAFLFINAAIVYRKEGATFPNLLTFLIGVGLLVFAGLYALANYFEAPTYLIFPLVAGPLVLAYFFGHFVLYLLSSILFNWQKPRYDKDYVIVLGAGLIDGRRVTPLLHQRIQVAMDFAREQERQTGYLPKLVMSGGQGGDEQVSEAFAMREDAIAHGFPKAAILMEDASTTTYENMQFSKALMNKDSQGANYKAIFATNNYHLFRAGLYAKKAGLHSDGIGSRTARYFVPNAFLREFVAYILMHKRIHLFISLVLVLLLLLWVLLTHLTQ